MMGDVDPVAALERLGGASTTAEVVALSSRERVRTAVARGEIIRLHRGRLALPAATSARKEAAALSGVVSHLSAALHWGWAVTWVPDRAWVTVPRDRKARSFRDGRAVVVRADLGPEDVADGVTSPLRTVVDCSRRLPFDQALAVADSALRSRRLTHRQLLDAAKAARGPGAARVRRVAARATPRAANPFESGLRAIALEFPELEVEPQGAVRTRYRTYHPDLVDRRRRLALEADSWEFHTGRDAHGRDCVRYTELTLEGWRVLRFTWEQVMHHPAYVRGVLAALLADDSEVHQPDPQARLLPARTRGQPSGSGPIVGPTGG